MTLGARVSLILLGVMLPTVSFASGFRLPEHDAKALGMAAAVVAQADNPSAIFYNAAGLTQLKGNWVSTGGTLIMAQGAQFEGRTAVSDALGLGTQDAKGKNQIFFTPDLFLVSSLGSERLRLGFGVYTPFGLGRRYEDQNLIFRNQLNNIKLTTVELNPTIAYKVSNVLSVGVGLDFVYARVAYDFTAFSTAINPVTGNLYSADARADGNGAGYNVGILISPYPKWKIGLQYRSRIPLHLKGNVDVDSHSAAVSAAFAHAFSSPSGTASFHDTAQTNVTFPDTFTIGVSFRPTERWTLEADADWTGWSTYKKLPFNTGTSVLIAPGKPIYGAAVLTQEKNWRNVWALRLGGQYKASERIALRAGYLYDRNPVPDATYSADIPDSDRQAGSVGIGYTGSRYTADLAYTYLYYRPRTVKRYDSSGNVVIDGTFKNSQHLVGLTVAYRF